MWLLISNKIESIQRILVWLKDDTHKSRDGIRFDSDLDTKVYLTL